MSESAAPPEASSSGGLFTRQSSGLVRELGIPAATAIALASVAVVNTFINFSAGFTSFSHPEWCCYSRRADRGHDGQGRARRCA